MFCHWLFSSRKSPPVTNEALRNIHHLLLVWVLPPAFSGFVPPTGVSLTISLIRYTGHFFTCSIL